MSVMLHAAYLTKQLDRRCAYHIEAAESFLLSTNRALLVLGVKNEWFAPNWGKGKDLR
jgi:hypothetical protein